MQSCGKYRRIKLMGHRMRLWERVTEARLKAEVRTCEQQYGFMPKKNTNDAVFALSMFLEKVRGSCIVSLWSCRKLMTGCPERNCGVV